MALISSIVRSTTSSPITFQNSSSTEIGTLCRAWVNFNGTGTVAIRGSFNVSSITDNGTGDYTVNFTTAMADANYSTVSLTALSLSSSGSFADKVKVFSQSTSGSRIETGYFIASDTFRDQQYIAVAIFR